MRGDWAQFKSAIGIWGVVVSSEFLVRTKGLCLFWISPKVFQFYCLTDARSLALMVLIPEARGRVLKQVPGGVLASVFFRFGVKSFGPLRTVVHLKSDRKLRVSSGPRQERK